MNIEDINHRIKLLEDRHTYQHKLVETLEAEKAPGEVVASAKVNKLKLKDEINSLKKMIEGL